MLFILTQLAVSSLGFMAVAGKRKNALDKLSILNMPKAKQVPENLPASSDKEFWGEDADIILIKKEQKERYSTPVHFPIYQVGGYFVCRGCPAEHTIPANPSKFTIKEGKLVPLDKTSK